MTGMPTLEQEVAEQALKDRMVAGTALPDHVPSFLREGVYFGLDEKVYHDDPALGSSDLKTLARSPPEFWFRSKFNSLWEPSEEDTPSKAYGTATHVMVLEGREKFNRLYLPVHEKGNTAAGKAERARAERLGKIWITQDFYERIELSGAMVRGNPELSQAFTGGVGSEVSIFWTCPRSGIRKKARIDKLKPNATVDLKTVSNPYGEDFPTVCRKAISTYRYDVQMVAYAEARAQLGRLVADGKVYDRSDGRTAIDHKMLERAAAATSWANVWVFIQSTSAPLTWGAKISMSLDEDGRVVSGNGLVDIGRSAIEQAEANWAAYVKRFNGLSEPWMLREPLMEASIDDFPTWSFR